MMKQKQSKVSETPTKNCNEDDSGDWTYHMFHSMRAEQEVIDIYEDESGIYPSAPPVMRLYSEEEQVERYAKHLVFWRKLKE